MLSRHGRLWISTSNRWSVSRDPQPGVPALSWLPMHLLDIWAEWHGLTFPQRALVGTKRLRRLLEGPGSPASGSATRTASGRMVRDPRTGARPRLAGGRCTIWLLFGKS